MDRAGIADIFAPVGPVMVRAMFGGFGVYRDDVIFGLAIDGEIYLKTDAESRSSFSTVGSKPFIYNGKRGEVETSYWRAPEEAFDDPDLMRKWARLALDAARRARAGKARKKSSAKTVSATGKSQPARRKGA